MGRVPAASGALPAGTGQPIRREWIGSILGSERASPGSLSSSWLCPLPGCDGSPGVMGSAGQIRRRPRRGRRAGVRDACAAGRSRSWLLIAATPLAILLVGGHLALKRRELAAVCLLGDWGSASDRDRLLRDDGDLLTGTTRSELARKIDGLVASVIAYSRAARAPARRRAALRPAWP